LPYLNANYGHFKIGFFPKRQKNLREQWFVPSCEQGIPIIVVITYLPDMGEVTGVIKRERGKIALMSPLQSDSAISFDTPCSTNIFENLSRAQPFLSMFCTISMPSDKCLALPKTENSVTATDCITVK